MDKEFIQSVIMLSDFKYYCDKAFKQQRILNNHQREHCKECSYCIYFRRNTNEKPYQRENSTVAIVVRLSYKDIP